ncbi:MAG TPA: hypothetical protein VFZ37_03265 [Jiangellaceae bacterium]
MGKTCLSLRRAGAVAVLAAVLLAGCGDDEASTDGGANGNDAGTETSEDDSSGNTGEPDEGSDNEETTEDDGMDDSSDAAADEDVETLEITIADGEVSPPFDTYEVARGADVRIEVTSDTADELHLHGYDLGLEVEPGEPAVLEFTADIEGRFELETHELGLPVLQLEVG